MAEFHVKTSEDGKLQGPFSSGQLKKLAEQAERDLGPVTTSGTQLLGRPASTTAPQRP